MSKRVIWIILDSVGIGELPDAAKFGDVGVNTLGNIARCEGGIHMPNMVSMGIGNIDGTVNFKVFSIDLILSEFSFCLSSIYFVLDIISGLTHNVDFLQISS